MHIAKYIQHNIRHSIVGISIVILAFVLYYPTLGVGFLSDDWHALSIARDTENIFHFFTTNIIGERGGSSYGPIWNMAMYVQYHLFGLHAIGYHIVSMMLLAMSTFVVYLFARRIFHHDLIAYGTALIFVTLPSHVEAVAWIAGQPHLIATVGYILALYWYTVFSSGKKIRYFFLALMSLAVSLGTKEIGITFVIPFLLIDWQNNRISARMSSFKATAMHIMRYYIPCVGLVGAYLVARAYATGVVVGYYGSTSLSFSITEAMDMAIRMSVGMFASFPMRDRIVEMVMAHAFVIGFGVTIMIGLIVWIGKSYRTAFLITLGMYISSLIPYLSVQYNALSNEGERYTYLPSLFAAMVIAGAGYIMVHRFQRVWYGILLAPIILFGISQIYSKNAEWVQAGNIVTETIESIMYVDIDPERPVIFVGLPDRIAGAQLFRNGTHLAIELSGYGKFTGDRVLMSPLLSQNYSADVSTIAVESCESGVGLTTCLVSSHGVERLFTGLPLVEMYGIHFILEDFRMSDHTGTQIRIEYEDYENADVQLLYFDRNSFRRISL